MHLLKTIAIALFAIFATLGTTSAADIPTSKEWNEFQAIVTDLKKQLNGIRPKRKTQNPEKLDLLIFIKFCRQQSRRKRIEGATEQYVLLLLLTNQNDIHQRSNESVSFPVMGKTVMEELNVENLRMAKAGNLISRKNPFELICSEYFSVILLQI